MSQQLFIRIRGRVHGPMDLARLQALVKKGQLSRIHEVSSDGKSWKPASTVPEIFEARTAAITESAKTLVAKIQEIPKPSESAAPAGEIDFGSIDPLAQPKEWHYAIDGNEYGPVTTIDMTGLLRSGTLSRTDMVWKEGMAQWGQISHLSEFTNVMPFAKQSGAGEKSSTSGGPTADPVKRLLAQLINGVVLVAPTLLFAVLFVIFMLATGVSMEASEGSEGLPELIAGLGTIGIVIGFALYVLIHLAILGTQLYLLTIHSQSIGKRWMKLQVVSMEDGQPADFAKTVILRYVFNQFIVTITGSLYVWADMLFIFRDDKRCLHDHLASTRVVDLSKRK